MATSPNPDSEGHRSDLAPGMPGAAAVPDPAAAAGRPRRRWRRVRMQPGRHDHLLPWLALAVCLLLTCVSLLPDLATPDVTRRDEARAIVTSLHTWQDADRFMDGGITLSPSPPRYNSQPVLDEPPGLTWLHMLAFTSLDRDEATPDRLVMRARAVSAAATLLAVAGVFWAGLSIGGLVTALLAGLVAATLPLLVATGRVGTGEMPGIAFAMLATASALWAARPFKPAASLLRQAIGWLLCGVALGALVLVAGLGPLPKVLLPLAVVLSICPRRIGYVIALSAATFVAALMVMPWAVYIYENEPSAWGREGWLTGLIPHYGQGLAGHLRWAGGVLGWLAIATLPWAPWLLGGLVQPFSTSSVGSRQRLFAGWAWFVSLLVVVLALPSRGGLGGVPALDVLLLLPAGALLVGQVFQQYKELSDQGRHVRYWTIVRYPHVIALLAASVCLPMALAQQDDLITDGWLSRPLVAPMGWLYWTGMSLALLLIAGLSLRFLLQHHPARTLACWAAWSGVTLGLLALAIARGPRAENPLRSDAEALAAVIDARPVWYLGPPGAARTQPDPVLMLYTMRHLPPRTPEQVASAADDGPPLYLLSGPTKPPGEVWREEYSLQSVRLRLWYSLGPQSLAYPAAPGEDLAQP